MKIGGEYLFFAPRQRVWQGLNDTSVLREAIPGCHHIDWTGPDTLDLVFKVNLGVAHPRFAGELVLSNVDPATRYTLSGAGKGGWLGLARGSADIELADHFLSRHDLERLEDAEQGRSLPPTGTLLHFSAHGSGSKQIMALGKKLLGNSARHVIDRFMERFATAMDVSVVSREHAPF